MFRQMQTCAILVYIICIVLLCQKSISWMALSVGMPSGCMGITMNTEKLKIVQITHIKYENK